MRTLGSIALALLALCLPAEAAPFGHLQTDKPTYRLGERLWFRLHTDGERPAELTVQLRGPKSVSAEAKLKPREAEGSFFLDPKWDGGTYTLLARTPAGVLHEAKLWIYDVQRPQLDLSMTILGEEHYPGDTLSAAFQARTRSGKPVAGAKVRYRAAFGDQVFQGWTGPTDDEGRSVVRLELPADLLHDGHLAVGVEQARLRAATARPVRLRLPVARVDAFPEGGTVVPGFATRMGLLARDVNGDPAVCEGRIVNDLGEAVADFATNERGQAWVEVPCVDERTYAVHVDRPLSAQTFALPTDTGHRFSLHTFEGPTGVLTVTVRSREESGKAELVLVDETGDVTRKTLRFSRGIEQVQLARKKAPGYRVERLLVLQDGAAHVDARVLRGKGWPLTVSTRILPGSRAPGSVVTCEVTTLLRGRPVSADLAISAFNTGATFAGEHTVPSLSARHALAPHVDGPLGDVSELFVPIEKEKDSAKPAPLHPAQALLWIRGSRVLPAEGLPLQGKALPDVDAGRVALAPIAPPARPQRDGDPETRTRATDLDLLLARASFTRAAPPRAHGNTTFRANVSEDAFLSPPGLGKKRSKLPQDQRVSRKQVDTRDTLLWSPQLVTTDKTGKAKIRWRLSQETSPLRIVAEGLAGGFAASSGTSAEGVVEREKASLQAEPLFHTEFEFPQHLRIGDRFAMRLAVKINDRDKQPLQVRVQVPACLQALDRTELTVNPRTSAPEHKLRFLVVKPAETALLRVVTTRGRFVETTKRSFSVGHADIEVTGGRAGYGSGAQTVSVKVPADAIPGSVRVHSRVSASSASEQAESVESMLRTPTGCFEQTTSSNWPNLLVLGNLLNESPDAALLERAFTLAHAGYERILSFQHESGGFTLWQNGSDPQPRYTAMAVAQLSEYGHLFHGKGLRPLRRALAWLRQHGGDGIESAYAAVASNAGAKTLLAFEPKTAYQQALVAERLASWRGEWKHERITREEALAERAAELAARVDPNTGAVTSEGRGIMGSSGPQLTIITTALTALALDAAGHRDRARHCMLYLAAQKNVRGGWGSTQSTVLASRAMATFRPSTPPELLTVELDPSVGGPLRSFISAGRNRPLNLSRGVDVQPGQPLRLRLRTEPRTDVEYGLGYSYRVNQIKPSKHAAYEVRISLPRATTLTTADAELSVRMIPRGPAPSGQVVARVGIPAGFAVELTEPPGGANAWELKDGAVVLYWASAPSGNGFSVPLRATNTGTFRSGPTVVYPYYAPERIAYAPSQSCKVFLEDAVDPPQNR